MVSRLLRKLEIYSSKRAIHLLCAYTARVINKVLPRRLSKRIDMRHLEFRINKYLTRRKLNRIKRKVEEITSRDIGDIDINVVSATLEKAVFGKSPIVLLYKTYLPRMRQKKQGVFRRADQ